MRVAHVRADPNMSPGSADATGIRLRSRVELDLGYKLPGGVAGACSTGVSSGAAPSRASLILARCGQARCHPGARTPTRVGGSTAARPTRRSRRRRLPRPRRRRRQLPRHCMPPRRRSGRGRRRQRHSRALLHTQPLRDKIQNGYRPIDVRNCSRAESGHRPWRLADQPVATRIRTTTYAGGQARSRHGAGEQRRGGPALGRAARPPHLVAARPATARGVEPELAPDPRTRS